MSLKPNAYFRFIGVVAIVLVLVIGFFRPSWAKIQDQGLTNPGAIEAIEAIETTEATEAQPTQNLPQDSPELAARRRRFNLTGRWEGDDGGMYFLRQIDHELWWYGQRADFDRRYDDRRDRDDRRDDRRRFSRRFLWSNVFHGYIGNREIVGSWVDDTGNCFF